ncbi:MULTISPECIES: glycosyltransferase family 4 protein [Actinosynnema]|uniref:glycosyltransferase family 4 protein n=1 Tax=Actinosynnema TaxID=40566 RepID=UPI0027E3979E|nr:glycosyltransferase family 4 protein [Actinosynnema pretiosum]MCP2096444.1 Glycosyltransferase involved in cell wall bisynthesis [Actinosynnema pretiosum]
MSAADLFGKHVLVLNWRDVRHGLAGGAEQYMHEIGRRWVAAGAEVTWFTAREKGAAKSEVIDGMRFLRAGGTLGVYGRAALRMTRHGHRFDAVVDCQNGIPFFSPLFLPRTTPVVQLVHHVHQDQFALRFPQPLAAVGRWLEGPVARRVYGGRAHVAVSPSTRREMRGRLKLRAPVFIVPNGTARVFPEVGRTAAPTIVVVGRLVPHKRVDLLLERLPEVLARFPDLVVHFVGDGPERERLRELAAPLGRAVLFHGRQPDAVRDELLGRAWLTASASSAEGWGCSVVEAAAAGVPCVGRRVPGIRDSVVDGVTGWLVDDERDLGKAVVRALRAVTSPEDAAVVAARCRAWAARFDWDRSADLLAGVLRQEGGAVRSGARRARSDIAAVVEVPGRVPTAGLVRSTDQVVVADGVTRLLLGGCDEVGAAKVVRRLGVGEARIRLATRYDLLAGPVEVGGAGSAAAWERVAAGSGSGEVVGGEGAEVGAFEVGAIGAGTVGGGTVGGGTVGGEGVGAGAGGTGASGVGTGDLACAAEIDAAEISAAEMGARAGEAVR